jgi:hypothetical protein
MKKLFQNSKGTWFASLTDQKGKRRFISLKTKDGKVAEQIAEQIVPHELARTREPIHKEQVSHLEEKAELCSPNWTRDGGCVLRAWAVPHLEGGATLLSNPPLMTALIPFPHSPTPAMNSIVSGRS